MLHTRVWSQFHKDPKFNDLKPDSWPLFLKPGTFPQFPFWWMAAPRRSFLYPCRLHQARSPSERPQVNCLSFLYGSCTFIILCFLCDPSINTSLCLWTRSSVKSGMLALLLCHFIPRASFSAWNQAVICAAKERNWRNDCFSFYSWEIEAWGIEEFAFKRKISGAVWSIWPCRGHFPSCHLQYESSGSSFRMRALSMKVIPV